MAEIKEPISYRDAMAELQRIVARLRDTENIDVDDLVKDVARAKQLLDFCGSKIKRADAAIKTIMGEIQSSEPEGPVNATGGKAGEI